MAENPDEGLSRLNIVVRHTFARRDPEFMLTETTIQELSLRTSRTVVCAFCVGLLAVGVYIGILWMYHDPIQSFALQLLGDTAARAGLFALFLASFPLLLAPILAAAHFVRRFALFCPECGIEITKDSQRVLFTRCCPACGQRIVDRGQVRDERMFTQYLGTERRRLGKAGLWLPPMMAVLFLAIHVWDSTALSRCPDTLYMPALLGTVSAGWTWLRTRDRDYCPQTVASFVLLTIGSYAWWRMV